MYAFNSLVCDLNVPEDKISIVDIGKENWEEMVVESYKKESVLV